MKKTTVPPLLTLGDVCLSFGGEPLFRGVSFSLQPQEKACLVGRNGSGKSTLMKLIAGMYEPDSGDVFFKPQTRVSYLPQEPDFTGVASLFEYVEKGLPLAEQDQGYRVEAALSLVGLEVGKSLSSLSGGEARRADLARALVGEPDLLLMDEPTNHLDIETILWLEDFLKSYKGAFLLISHDRAFLTNLTTKTLWLDRGVIRELAEGFGAFETWSEALLEQEEREMAKLDKRIKEETRWSHQGITARRKRNQGRLRRLYEMRSFRAAQISNPEGIKLTAESGDVSSKLVVEAKNIAKSYGERVILKKFSTRILRGQRVGIVGPNGAGKSTLLKLLTGELAPDEGRIRIGKSLNPVFIDQNRSDLKPNETLWETLCPQGGDQVMVQGQPRHVVGYLKDFLFTSAQARSPVRALSGGERNRLLLAKHLAKPSNLLILDEPTNDLDVESLDLLQDVLSEYDGTLLLVSHDRDFLDRLVTSTILLDGQGGAIEYAGGYTDAMRQKALSRPLSEKTEGVFKKNSPAVTVKSSTPKSRLSYKENWLLENLPKTIEDLSNALQEIELALSDGSLFSSNPKKFEQLSTDLLKKQEELEKAELQWLELDEKRLFLESEAQK